MNGNDVLTGNTPEIKELLSMVEQINENMEQGKDIAVSEEQYLDNKQVCELLHISQRTLQDYRDKGRISFYKLEGKILYKLTDIEKMLENNYYKAWE